MKNYRVRQGPLCPETSMPVRHGCHDCVDGVLHDGARRCTKVAPAARVDAAGMCDYWTSRAVTLAEQQAEQNPGLPTSQTFRARGAAMEAHQPTVVIGGKPA